MQPSPGSNSAVQAIIAAKVKYLAPMILIYTISYIGLTVLAGFAKDFMGIKAVGSFNMGFLLIALNYLLSWVIAIAYTRIANRVFDPMSAQLRKQGMAR